MATSYYKIYQIDEPKSMILINKRFSKNDELKCVRSFKDKKTYFQGLSLCNPNYGFFSIQSNNIIDNSNPFNFDNWNDSMKQRQVKTSIYGNLEDLKLFEELFISQKKINGYIMCVYIESVHINKNILLKYRVNNLNNFLVHDDNKQIYLKKNNFPVYRFYEFVTEKRFYIDQSIKLKNDISYPHIEQTKNNEIGKIRFKKDFFQIINNNYLIKSSVNYRLEDKIELLNKFINDGGLVNVLNNYDLYTQEYPLSKIPNSLLDVFNTYDEKEKKRRYKRINKKCVLDENGEIIVDFILLKKKKENEVDSYLVYKFNFDFISKYYFEDANECEDNDFFEDMHENLQTMDELYREAFENDPDNIWNID